MYLQTRATLRAFPVATPRGRSSSSHGGEHQVHVVDTIHLLSFFISNVVPPVGNVTWKTHVSGHFNIILSSCVTFNGWPASDVFWR